MQGLGYNKVAIFLKRRSVRALGRHSCPRIAYVRVTGRSAPPPSLFFRHPTSISFRFDWQVLLHPSGTIIAGITLRITEALIRSSFV